MPRSYDSPGSARSERVKKKLPARLENVFTKLRSECLGAIDDRTIALDTRVKHLEQLLKDQKDRMRQIIDDNPSEMQSLVARLSEKEQMLKEQREEIRDLKSRLQDSEELSQRRAKEMQRWRSNISGMLEFSL
jgi:predicted nuclease with TOPRIM domain